MAQMPNYSIPPVKPCVMCGAVSELWALVDQMP